MKFKVATLDMIYLGLLLVLVILALTLMLFIRQHGSVEEAYTNAAPGAVSDSTILATPLSGLAVFTVFNAAHTARGREPKDEKIVSACLDAGARCLDFEVVYTTIAPGVQEAMVGNNNDYDDWSNTKGSLLLKDVAEAVATYSNSKTGLRDRPLFIHLRIRPTVEPQAMAAFCASVNDALEPLNPFLVPPDLLPSGSRLANLRPADMAKGAKYIHIILDCTSPVPGDGNISDETKQIYRDAFDNCALHSLAAFTSAHHKDNTQKDTDVVIRDDIVLGNKDLKTRLIFRLPPPISGYFFASDKNSDPVFDSSGNPIDVQFTSLHFFIKDRNLRIAQRGGSGGLGFKTI